MEFEYGKSRLIAEEGANGWRIEIISEKVEAIRTASHRNLSDAIDEAKMLVDAINRRGPR
jgi:hypothetical protein